jgi:hypothetical protein
MTHRLAALCLGLPVLGAAQPSLGEMSIQRPAQVAHTERVNFAPGGTIRLNDSFGDLYIEGWDQPAVEMSLIKETQGYRTPKNASEQLGRVRFTTEHPSANELTISTAIPSHSFFRHPFGGKGDITVRYELHVPRDSRLRIHRGGGNILVGNIIGGIEATNRNGDIVLWLPGPGPYSIDAKSKMGTVISDFTGKTRVRYFVGEGFTDTNESTAHPVHLRVGFGGISIKEIPPEAEP